MQSLTVQPTVRDGIITYEDSALVRAVRSGHALVVDEADKAPTYVTCVLKALLESGRATLADGRKIVTGMYVCILITRGITEICVRGGGGCACIHVCRGSWEAIE